MADYERLDTGDAILGRSSDQRKASDHSVFHDKVHLAKRRIRALAFKTLEEIAVIGLRANAVALLDRLGNLLADGTSPGAIGILPSQAVLLSGVSKVVMLADGATAVAEAFFAGDYSATDGTEANRRTPSNVLRIRKTLERFTLADVDVMLALL